MGRKEKGDGEIKMPIIIAVVVIVLVIIGIVFFVKVSKGGFAKNENSASGETQQTESASQEGASLIDMSNKENVEIVSGEKVNNAKDVTKDRELDGLKLTDIKLKTEGGISKFTATVKNDTGKDYAGGIVSIKFKYENGKDEELQASIPSIKAGGTSAIDAGTTSDIVNAKDFTMELLK